MSLFGRNDRRAMTSDKSLAYGIGLWVYPYFPRRVSITNAILVQLALVVLAISIISSLLGIRKAMSVQPNEVLA